MSDAARQAPDQPNRPPKQTVSKWKPALGPGRRPLDVQVGVVLLPLIFVVVIAVQLGVRMMAPFLHNVEVSPFEALLGSP